MAKTDTAAVVAGGRILSMAQPLPTWSQLNSMLQATLNDWECALSFMRYCSEPFRITHVSNGNSPSPSREKK